jgi:hypothetical protein
MKATVAISVSLLTMVVGSCEAAPDARRPSLAPLTRLFGPVISQQVIAGREEEPNLVMLLTDRRIVRVDLDEQRAWSTAIQVDAGERCWGLARLTDGSLWTLKGRNAAVRIEPDGRVSRVIPLSEPHAGLFAVGDRLVYQRAVATAPEPALRAATPGGDQTTWSGLRVRSFPGLDRAQASALSLVACGLTRVPERACWFPDEAAVALVAPDGQTRRLELPGLTAVAPEVLLTAENPPRPVRDAYVDDRRRIWVLSSGEPRDGSAEPGGWILARYGPDGAPDGQARLAEPARLILRVETRRVIVLAGSGHVSEIASW